MRIALFAMLPLAALAFESEPRTMVFADSVDVFESAEYTTGWLPADSPLQIQFSIDSRGGAYTEFEATSQLEWPQALSHSWTGVPETGVFELVTDLRIAVDVRFDLWGVSFTESLWEEVLEMDGVADFDPMLLPGRVGGASVTADNDGDAVQAVEIPVDIMTGVSLNLILDVWPYATATLEGLRVETGDTAIEEMTGTALFDVPADHPGHIDLASVFVTRMDAKLGLVLEPSVEVCVIAFGCYEIASFEIPVDLVDVSEERAFPEVTYSHPLPALHTDAATYDFGEVEVGGLANMELPIANIGELDLEGWVSIRGSEDLSVYPEYIHATEGNTDGVVVTFAPSAEGLLAATVVIESNDPRRPTLEIPVAGTGFITPTAGDDDVKAEFRTCGCSAAGGVGVPFLALVGLIGVAFTRRRRGAGRA